MLRRCPEPTLGRIPISRISWYLRSMRTFCGGRLLPACPRRRSGPSPGPSSPASSFLLYPHNRARSRNAVGWPREDADWFRGSRCPLKTTFAVLLVTVSVGSEKQTVLFHPTGYETHIQTPRGSASRPRLNIASSSTRRDTRTPWRWLKRHKWTTGGQISVSSHVSVAVFFLPVFSCRFRLHFFFFFSSNSRCRSGLSQSFDCSLSPRFPPLSLLYYSPL